MPYSQIALEELKESFKADINSNRAYFKVQTFKDLMKILEKRDVLNMECLNPLQKIESVLRFYFSGDSQDLQLKSPASDFQDLVLNSPVSPLNRNPLSDDNDDDDSRILCNPKVKKRVYELIGTEIGRKWRDFGRELNLRESALEELEEKYKTIKDRTYAILLFHEKNCDERY
ncbi:hypothetical protein HHI36_015653 [Cryptolaemus montrouzieri]|uniref:Death domain-containing protein n=1 Tax=Cryptolaemus montrouzieri TaxID=559131 RepID=A0ABD2N686_9CUCU